jgi:hypothetical protein
VTHLLSYAESFFIVNTIYIILTDGNS